MGIWFMNLSDYMGGRCLCKLNSMGGGVKKKSAFFPLQVFFSGIALSCLGHANMRAFHENPNPIHSELTFVNP